jgi:ABC-type transport system involved in multi-copper enzyme maturation permease subunit
MISLASTEMARFLARRLVRVILLLAVAGIVLAAVIVFFQSSPSEPDRFELESLPEVFMGTGVPIILMAWLFGASFVGAEWQRGTMTTALTWEPRRIRLFVAKLVATVVTTLILAVVLQTLLGLALTPAAALRGSTAGIGGSWSAEAVGAVLRGATVAAVGAAIAFSIAMAGRNTGAALGIGFAYGAIAEPFLRAWKPQWAPWLFSDNAARFISAEEIGFPPVARTTTESALLIIVYALLLAALSAALFRRRDVT